MKGRTKLPLDASVLINLVATSCCADILAALEEEPIVVRKVFDEVVRDPRSNESRPGLLQPFVDEGLVVIIEPDGAHLQLWLELAGAEPPDDLDDGEAATMAYAVLNQTDIALDDGKGIRVGKTRLFRDSTIHTTVDLLRRPAIERAIGTRRLTEAVHDALRFARMRVANEEHAAWIVDTIGVNAAKECPSMRRMLKNHLR